MEEVYKGIWQIKEFLCNEECSALAFQAELAGFRPASMHNTGRYNKEVFLCYQDGLNEIFKRLQECVKEHFDVTGIGDILEFYLYETGDFIIPHYDKSEKLTNNVFSNFTLMIYLNDDFEGGETFFPDVNIKISPECGKAVLFEHSILHEGARVLSGMKYIVRTDIAFKREKPTTKNKI